MYVRGVVTLVAVHDNGVAFLHLGDLGFREAEKGGCPMRRCLFSFTFLFLFLFPFFSLRDPRKVRGRAKRALSNPPARIPARHHHPPNGTLQNLGLCRHSSGILQPILGGWCFTSLGHHTPPCPPPLKPKTKSVQASLGTHYGRQNLETLGIPGQADP